MEKKRIQPLISIKGNNELNQLVKNKDINPTRLNKGELIDMAISNLLTELKSKNIGHFYKVYMDYISGE